MTLDGTLGPVALGPLVAGPTVMRPADARCGGDPRGMRRAALRRPRSAGGGDGRDLHPGEPAAGLARRRGEERRGAARAPR